MFLTRLDRVDICLVEEALVKLLLCVKGLLSWLAVIQPLEPGTKLRISP